MTSTKVRANGLSVIQTTTKANSNNIVRHTDLGLLALSEQIYNSDDGKISFKQSEVWANTVNLWSSHAESNIPGGMIFTQPILMVGEQQNENSLARLQQYLDIPETLLVTTTGSFDVQFSIQNRFRNFVDEPGTPNYILSFSNAPYSPQLNVGYQSTNLNDYDTVGTAQNTAPYILGNATALGGNYTVINAQFNELLSTFLPNVHGYNAANPGVTYDSTLGGNTAFYVRGTVTMVFDAAIAANLEDNEFNGDKINPKWRGNYRFTAFSALFKVREERFWNVFGASTTQGRSLFNYEINMTPFTDDPDDPDYGKYTVAITVASPQSRNSSNIGLRWLVTVNKFRNFVV
jgi:hypothetical protein